MAKKAAKKSAAKTAKKQSGKKSATKAISKKTTSKKSTAAKGAASKATSRKVAVKKTGKKGSTIAVDFDGVLHGYSKGFGDGTIYDPPVPGAREAMEELQAAGYKLYIYSTRSNKIYRKKDDPDQNEAMKAWLEKHSIPFDRIWSFGKPMADIYLDNRAIGFRGDWKKTVKEIYGFKTWLQQKT